MSEQQRRVSNTYRKTQNSKGYVEGNTVRRLEELPEYQPQKKRRSHEVERTRQKPGSKTKSVLAMNPGYVLFLAVSVMITLGILILYIQLQSEVNKRMGEIAVVEEQILDLQTKNDALLKAVETSVNMEEMKDRAMNQMGMVYPKEEQVVYFSIQEDDYMNQYRDIPEK